MSAHCGHYDAQNSLDLNVDKLSDIMRLLCMLRSLLLLGVQLLLCCFMCCSNVLTPSYCVNLGLKRRPHADLSLGLSISDRVD